MRVTHPPPTHHIRRSEQISGHIRLLVPRRAGGSVNTDAAHQNTPNSAPPFFAPDVQGPTTFSSPSPDQKICGRTNFGACGSQGSIIIEAATFGESPEQSLHRHRLFLEFGTARAFAGSNRPMVGVRAFGRPAHPRHQRAEVWPGSAARAGSGICPHPLERNSKTRKIRQFGAPQSDKRPRAFGHGFLQKPRPFPCLPGWPFGGRKI